MTTTGSTRARLAGRRAATTERSKLERAATLDPLTGLLTRTKAADHFAQLRRGGQASNR
jgi:GGDEF domain-containing protein